MYQHLILYTDYIYVSRAIYYIHIQPILNEFYKPKKQTERVWYNGYMKGMYMHVIIQMPGERPGIDIPFMVGWSIQHFSATSFVCIV